MNFLRIIVLNLDSIKYALGKIELEPPMLKNTKTMKVSKSI